MLMRAYSREILYYMTVSIIFAPIYNPYPYKSAIFNNKKFIITIICPSLLFTT